MSILEPGSTVNSIDGGLNTVASRKTQPNHMDLFVSITDHTSFQAISHHSLPPHSISIPLDHQIKSFACSSTSPVVWIRLDGGMPIDLKRLLHPRTLRRAVRGRHAGFASGIPTQVDGSETAASTRHRS